MKLNTNDRSAKRQLFNEMMNEKERKKMEEERRQREEEERMKEMEVEEFRKQSVFKA